jgi:hypothetical protein
MATRIIKGIRFTTDTDGVYRAQVTASGHTIDVWAWKTDFCWHYGTNTYGHDENKGSASSRDVAIEGAIAAGITEAQRYAEHVKVLEVEALQDRLTLNNARELAIASEFPGVTLKIDGAADAWVAWGTAATIDALLDTLITSEGTK